MFVPACDYPTTATSDGTMVTATTGQLPTPPARPFGVSVHDLRHLIPVSTMDRALVPNDPDEERAVSEM
jgi:hypothetical protein